MGVRLLFSHQMFTNLSEGALADELFVHRHEKPDNAHTKMCCKE